jgi:ParB family chromosome partitioning protein
MDEEMEFVELSRVKPNRLNPRIDVNIEALNELAESIKQVGLIEPVLVRPRNGEYEVVVGERRYRAAQQAGLGTIPVIIKHYSDDEVIEINLIENIQRADLSAVEKGRTCKRLLEDFPEKYPAQINLATKLGVTSRTIEQWMELVLVTSATVQGMIAPETSRAKVPSGKIDWWTGHQLGKKIKDEERQVRTAQTLVKENIRGRNAQKVISEVAKRPNEQIETIAREVKEKRPTMPFQLKHAEMIKKGTKTQTSRKSIDVRIREGTPFEVWTCYTTASVDKIQRKKLGDFTDDDAKREGYDTLEEFKEVWKGLHGRWDDNETVYAIQFSVKEK